MKSKSLVAACACVVALAACNAQKPPAEQNAAPAASVAAPATVAAAANKTAEIPTLSLPTIDGKRFDLASHRGRWVVVNFWATWCGPCLKEMPALSALDTMREYIDVVGLAYEDTTPEKMQAFLKKHPVSYPVALADVYAPPKDFATPVGLPTTYLIAPDGKVVKHFLGPIEAQDIETAIAGAGGPKPGAQGG